MKANTTLVKKSWTPLVQILITLMILLTNWVIKLMNGARKLTMSLKISRIGSRRLSAKKISLFLIQQTSLKVSWHLNKNKAHVILKIGLAHVMVITHLMNKIKRMVMAHLTIMVKVLKMKKVKNQKIIAKIRTI